MTRVLLLFVLLSMVGCGTSRHTCTDLYSSKQEKLPFKYRRVTNASQRVPQKRDELVAKSIASDTTALEIPFVASIAPEVSLIQELSSVKKAEISQLIEQVNDEQALKVEHKPQGEISKKDLRKSLRRAVKDSKQLGDDPETLRKAKTLGLISFISAIGSFLFFPLCIVGLVTGILSLKKYEKLQNKDQRIWAILGVVFSGLYLLLLLILIVVLVYWFSTGWS